MSYILILLVSSRVSIIRINKVNGDSPLPGKPDSFFVEKIVGNTRKEKRERGRPRAPGGGGGCCSI